MIRRSWKQDGFTLYLSADYSRKDESHYRICYRFLDNGKLIFAGNDLGIPLHTRHLLGKNTIASLLGFLSLKDGDTDSEYFDKYTPEQIAWRDSSRCDDLQMIAYDMREDEWK